MRYTYDETGRLRCDRCGNAGGVRKRTCPYKVLGDSLRGPRIELPYCYPAALCNGCYGALGGVNGVHGQRCRAGAAASQARDDAIEAALDAGESLSISAFGDWDNRVPAGQVGVIFSGRAGKSYRLMPEADYPNKSMALSSVAGSEEWVDHP